MRIQVGICGTGEFADYFIPLFKVHPQVSRVVLCDLDKKKLQDKAEKFGISETCPSLDELCQSDVDAIFIITQHHLHGPQAVQALKSGKHVYSAVPPAISMDEIKMLVKTVEQTGKIYMLGETSYYYPCTIYCRERFNKGDFGHIVYGEAEYYHDYSHGLYDVLKHRHGSDWERYANWPPFFYPTHSVSMITSVTGAYATGACGMGIVDNHPDGLFNRKGSFWNNNFSNEAMLCRMSDGSVARFNEFRRIGHPGTVRMSLHGTEAGYEEQHEGKMWVTKDTKSCIDLRTELDCLEVSKIHPVHRLPKEFLGLESGHCGSHHFLVDDFVKSCVSGAQPPINIYQAARYVIPGLIGHESAMQGGVLLDVPDFGDKFTD